MVSEKLFFTKVVFELLEYELFSVLQTVSWADTLSCLFAYFFVFSILSITLILPLALFVVIFIA